MGIEPSILRILTTWKRAEVVRGETEGNTIALFVSDYAKPTEEKCFTRVRRRTEGNTVRNEVMP